MERKICRFVCDTNLNTMTFSSERPNGGFSDEVMMRRISLSQCAIFGTLTPIVLLASSVGYYGVERRTVLQPEDMHPNE